jgi:hypothetical protein
VGSELSAREISGRFLSWRATATNHTTSLVFGISSFFGIVLESFMGFGKSRGEKYRVGQRDFPAFVDEFRPRFSRGKR